MMFSLRQPFLMLIFAASAALTERAMAQPVISSGKILSPTVDVSKPAASPLVKLHVSGDPVQINFTYQGPSGERFPIQFDTYSSDTKPFPATVELQGYNIAPFATNANTFSAFSEPGTWTLISLNACDISFNCVFYSGSALSALFPSLTVSIVNPNTPDFTGPVAIKGKIKTPTVSSANGTLVKARLSASDNVSGVAMAQVCAMQIGFGQPICLYSAPLYRPLLSANFDLTGTLYYTPPGTYVVTQVNLFDIAGNSTVVNDPAAISTLFNGEATITVGN